MLRYSSRMRFILVALGLALFSTACTPPVSEIQTTTSTTSSTIATAVGDVPECLAGELPFVDEGVVAALDSQGRDARAIGDVRWVPSDGCERIEVTFLSGAGAPASSIGPVGVSILADSGIVRVNLAEEITESAVADTTLNGTLTDRWFVVEGLGDGLVLDLHLGERAAARAFSTISPARLVIDLIPVDDDRPITRPIENGGFVLLSPQPGIGLYPLQVAGYAAPGVDAVRVQLTDQTGVAIDRAISTRSSAYTWHAFGLTLDDGPSGTIDLFVGTIDENDEQAAGVNVPLDLP